MPELLTLLTEFQDELQIRLNWSKRILTALDKEERRLEELLALIPELEAIEMDLKSDEFDKAMKELERKLGPI